MQLIVVWLSTLEMLGGRTCTGGAAALDHLIHSVYAVAAQIGWSLLSSA